ncbi:MAG: PLP-dependent cysteine synthase family protein [Thermoproteota archaeon]
MEEYYYNFLKVNNWFSNLEKINSGKLNKENLKVGNTPLIKLENIKTSNLELYAKLEWLNLFGSIKDRAAYWMIKIAEEKGLLNKNKTIIEPTSGNMGIALACISRSLGYKFTAVVPQAISEETKNLIRYLGAELLETSDDLCPRVGKGTDQSIALAKGIVNSFPNEYYMPNQYENEANFLAHYEGTGPEIWAQTKGNLDYFITGIGTGGTVTGVGTFLKQRSNVKIIAVQPQQNHHIQGLRNLQESDKPLILAKRFDVIDSLITISDEEAFKAVRMLAENEKLLVGPSSGAVLAAALKMDELGFKGKAVLIFADDALKYYSVYKQFNVLKDEELDKLKGLVSAQNFSI